VLSSSVRAFLTLAQLDGYRGCTCAWAHLTDHSPPHGCTAEVHCAIASGEPLPPNCSSGAVWSAPNSSQLLYSWDPRGNSCLNATINCVSGAQPLTQALAAINRAVAATDKTGDDVCASVVPAMQYYCPLQGSACTDCWKRGAHRNALLAANCTDTAAVEVCSGNAGPGVQFPVLAATPAVQSAPIGPGAKQRQRDRETQRDTERETERDESQATQALAARVQVLEEQLSRVLASLDAKPAGR